MEELKRFPYQTPQTSMERHLVELVEHVRNGTDNRSGFAQKIEAAQDHAFWLEKAVHDLRRQVVELERAMMPRPPDINCNSRLVDTRDPSGHGLGGCVAFDWTMEQIRYRAIKNGFDEKDEKTMLRVRRRAYRDILTRFRAEFERTWTRNFAASKAA